MGSRHPDVVGYRIYKGTTFTDEVATADPSENEAFVDGLVPHQEYTFGVRSFDKYGREDANSRTVAVKVMNQLPPRFDGIAPADLSGSDGVRLKSLVRPRPRQASCARASFAPGPPVRTPRAA